MFQGLDTALKALLYLMSMIHCIMATLHFYLWALFIQFPFPGILFLLNSPTHSSKILLKCHLFCEVVTHNRQKNNSFYITQTLPLCSTNIALTNQNFQLVELSPTLKVALCRKRSYFNHLFLELGKDITGISKLSKMTAPNNMTTIVSLRFSHSNSHICKPMSRFKISHI